MTLKILSTPDFQTLRATNAGDPTSPQDLATKAYIDARRLDQAAAPTASVSLNSQKITNLLDPTSAQDAATKSYVDAAAAGIDFKASVRAISTTNITLSAPQTIDGVSIIAGDRVLVAGQSTGSQNGIYVAAAGSWARSADADSSAEVNAGMFAFVEEGTTYADSGWVLTTNNPITLASTALVFTQYSQVGTILGGAGLLKTGTTIDLVATDTSLTVAADSVGVNVNGTAGLQISSGLGIKLNGATLTLGASGLSVTASTFQPLDATLTSLAAFNTNGLLTQTAADTFTGRTLTGTAARITVTNGDGVSGNPTVDVAATYVGQSSITTLGTVTTGVWNGTAVPVLYGGTGATTAAGARSNLAVIGKYSNAGTHGAGSPITITQATHGLASNGDLQVEVYEVSTGDRNYPDINVNNANGTVTVNFTTAPSANTYRVVITG